MTSDESTRCGVPAPSRRKYELHRLAAHGDLQGLRDILSASDTPDIDETDNLGFTPLMHAVQSPQAHADLVQLLLERGADIHRKVPVYKRSYDLLSLALADGDPQKVSVLLECGANLHYRDEAGYDALINAVYGRDVMRDSRLIELLTLLITKGVALNGVTTYNESVVRVLSRIGRFDAVHLLLNSGADASDLQWTPLMRAVALGSLGDVMKEIESGTDLEAMDWWDRTAWLIAVQTGDISKAKLLLENGADAGARGRGKQPALGYAIQSYRTSMLEWLLEIGTPPDAADGFHFTPLICAIEYDNTVAVDALLKAGADVNGGSERGATPLKCVRTRELAVRLLGAGADPTQLSYEGRRAMLGFNPESDKLQLTVSSAEFQAGRKRRFGNTNPEQIKDRFWEGMIRSGIAAYEAGGLYEEKGGEKDSPTWCAQRFGQTITFLPDGRIVQVAGEHEDFCDEDFCIYNDVFVHSPTGEISIFAYPESVFPPTDFHTATACGEYIYLIGSLGYSGKRRYGSTPVYRLDTTTFQIEVVETHGDLPGWIHCHRAVRLSEDHIGIEGGTIVTLNADTESHEENRRFFVLDIRRREWSLS